MNQQIIISSKHKSNEIMEYSSLRVIATLLVVLGHCYYYKIDTLWGGVDYSHLIIGRNDIFLLIQQLHAFIKVFHMPLFMALSGALFRITWLKGKYKCLFDVIVDKGKRLMIPFFIVSICYSFPIKLLTGYYSTSDNVIGDFIVGQLFVQGNTHLWYLPALFFIFLIAFLLEKYTAGHRLGKLFVILVAYLISSKVSWQLLSYVLEYLLWFYVGYVFEINRERVNDKINVGTTIIAYFLGVILYILYHKLGNYNFFIADELFEAITVISLCLCVYVCAYGISKLRITETHIFKRLNNDSFGIYLYSDPLNYVILFAGAYLFGYTLYSSNASVLLLFIIRFFGTVIFSVIVTFFVRKLRLKYLC